MTSLFAEGFHNPPFFDLSVKSIPELRFNYLGLLRKKLDFPYCQRLLGLGKQGS
jgi:hypothetical protein